jgi:tetratricopeptide (TPR) repeat protein
MRLSRKRALIPVALLPVLGFLAGCAQTPEQKYARHLERGKKLVERQESSRAILELYNAIREQPEEAEAYYWIAQAFLGRNQVREAIASLRRAVEFKPGHSAAQLKLAELMIRTKDEELLKDAEARVQKILTDNPGDEDALFTLAASHAQLGRVEEAEKYLNEALLRSPSHLRAGIALALIKVSQNDLPAAEQILKKAIQQAPNSADAAAALATVYTGMNRLAEAETLLMKAVDLNKDYTEAWIALGSVQVQAGKKAAAEQSYKRAAASPKTRAPLAYIVFLIRQNRRREATIELERMFKANQNNRIARTALVASYMTANRKPEAESILDEALKINPRDVEALLQRSQIYLQKRRFDDAHADVDRVLSVQSSAQAHYLRSKIFWVKGDDLKRRQELDSALQLSPDSLRVRIELADAELRANRAKAALRILDEAPPHQKRTLAFAIGYGWALIGFGDAVVARKILDQALAVFKDPELLLQDAVLKLATRDFAGARRSVDQVLETNAEDLRAVSLLGQSYSAQSQRSTATERIRKMVKDHPKSLRLQLFWAQWLLEDNQRLEARKALADAAAADPKSTDPLFLSAGLDFSERQFATARNTLKILFRLDDKNVNGHILAGQVEEAAGYNRDATDHYKKALAVDGNNVVALNNLAYILSHDPARVEEALAFARKAKEFAPESPQVMDTLGWLYYRKGLYELAARELEGALAQAEWPSIQLHLGLTYNRLGNTKKGQLLVAAALAKEPKLADMLQ